MDGKRYQAFTQHLVAFAETDPEVVGLVALGSMAGGARQPDQWSDHDLWIVTSGDPARLRADRSWLPEPDRIVLSYAETEHGTNVIYADGHLIEYAVFGPGELNLTRANEYRVLVDKQDIDEQMRAVVAATETGTPDIGTLFGRFAGQLLIGVARYGRGETLSAESMLRKWALENLLSLIAAAVEPEVAVPLDNLDPRRRFETAYPSIGGELADAAIAPVPDAARVMLAVAARHVPDAPGNTPQVREALLGLIERAQVAGR